jgi:hypothetical protein
MYYNIYTIHWSGRLNISQPPALSTFDDVQLFRGRLLALHAATRSLNHSRS